MRIENSLCFDDVLLVPRYSDIVSRKEIDLRSTIGDERYRLETYNLPIISSPMDTITENEMAIQVGMSGGLGVIHRYNTLDELDLILREIERTNYKRGDALKLNVSVAVGVSGDYRERSRLAFERGVRNICIDVAHGHHSLVQNAIYTLRKDHGNLINIIAGNVATLEGFNDLADWGANAIRVGIGGGSICSTRIQTGHGMPTLQSIMECSKSDRKAALIADGGIRNSGDIVKALAAGADFVMVGSLLSGTDETPGEVIVHGGKKQKVYRGMASRDAQIDWRGHSSSLEGVSSLVTYRGPLKPILEDLEQGIRSGLSYSGCRNIIELQRVAKFIRQSSAGSVESSTHISRIGVLK